MTEATKGLVKVNKHRHKGQQLSLSTTSSTEKKKRPKAKVEVRRGVNKGDSKSGRSMHKNRKIAERTETKRWAQ